MGWLVVCDLERSEKQHKVFTPQNSAYEHHGKETPASQPGWGYLKLFKKAHKKESFKISSSKEETPLELSLYNSNLL